MDGITKDIYDFFILMLFSTIFTIVIHEIGHIIVAKIFGCEIKRIIILKIDHTGIEFQIAIRTNKLTSKQKKIVYICGPIAGMLSSILLIVLILCIFKWYFSFTAVFPLCFNAINLHPSFTDGSQIWKKD